MSRFKPHTKIYVSVAYHAKTQEIWADPIKRGMLVEIWRLALTRYAGKNGNVLGLRPLDRMSITGAESQSDADRSLLALLRSLKYRTRKYTNRWDVTIRNYAEKHGMEGSESNAIKSGNRTHNKNKNKEQRTDNKKREEAGRYRAPPTLCPEDLSEEQREKIRTWASTQVPPIPESKLARAWELFRAWAESDQHERRDWPATFRKALLKGWVLGTSGPPGESPAEGRQRRTRENARKALDILDKQTDRPHLAAITGGATT